MLQFNFARTQSKNATFQLFMFIIKLAGKSCFLKRYSHLNIVKSLFKQDGKQKAKWVGKKANKVKEKKISKIGAFFEHKTKAK